VLPLLLQEGNSKSFPGKNQSFSALKNGFSAEKNDLSAGIEDFSALRNHFSAGIKDFSALRNHFSAGIKDFSALRNHFSAGIKGVAVRKTRFSALGNGFSAVRNNGKVNKYERLRCEDVSRRREHILLYEHRSLLSRSLRLVLTIFRLCYFFRRKKTLKLTLKMLVFGSEHITQC